MTTASATTSTQHITLAQWVPMLLRWLPLRHGIVVGASGQALKHLNGATLDLSLFQAIVDPKTAAVPHAQSTHDTGNTRPWLIAGHNGSAIFYQASLPSESGLLAPQALKACWPGIQCVAQHEHQARTLDNAWQQIAAEQAHGQPSHPAPNWLWVGSLPAAPVLSGAPQLLLQADVVAVRVALQPEAEAHAGVHTVQDLLAAQGMVLCGIEPERNPKLGTALFVRDHVAAHDRARLQLQEQGNVHSQQLAQAASKLQEAQQQVAALAHAIEAQALASEQAQAQARQEALVQVQSLHQQQAEQQQAHAEQYAQLKAQLESAQQQLAALNQIKEAEVLVNQQSQAQLQAQIQVQQQQHAEQQEVQAQQLAQVTAQLQAAQQEIAALSTERDAQAQARQEALVQVQSLHQQQAEQQQAHAEQHAQLKAQLQAEVTVLAQARDAEAEGRVAESNARNHDVADLHRQLDDWQRRFAAMEADKQALEQQTRVLQEELIKAEAQLELIESLLLPAPKI